ncbi:flagellar biosynthesis protein FlhG [Ruminiclostridium sufflavum DSM 19573]|uniref:Flagellar biosynthesis protein FlhG n=1 Tax=Ruminiclostridium sufflavum DSM 19573 TaxID=1121337 RepID=A0A318XTM6_9FIRM|nr:MinD/ParA family protein [Ruminiclostridium sufflavum]PYG89839.1 flagellar biosynthesis protein FlhG [Ruminiclostridium sufflavum DSM 19573]
MIDQAEKLRNIVNNIKKEANDISSQNINHTTENIGRRHAKVITITSGKGGVGKTSVTVNLAIALSQKGYRVVIIDADLGLSNIDVVFGIVPKYSLLDLINCNKGILDILCEGPNNIKFISGGSGVQELINLDKNSLESFIANMSLLDHIADYILVDTGAGLSDTVMDFVISAEEVILVVTPEPTSITDAYAVVKTVSRIKKDCNINVLINRADSENEAKNVYNNFSAVAERFLSMKLNAIGYLPYDHSFTKSVKLQKPYILNYPKSNTSKLIKDIADIFIKNNLEQTSVEQLGIKGFINRFVGLFTN